MLGHVILLLSNLPVLVISQNWATSHKSFFNLTPAPYRPGGEFNQGLNRGLTDFSNTEIEAIVDHHNNYRRNTRPEGANLRHMQWDGNLATMAQDWADLCNFEHGGFEPNISPFDAIGQNLYVASEGSVEADSGIVATDKWHDEEEFYEYNSNSCTSVCGHYTQVVWARTYKVGCGRRRCGRVSNVFFNDPSYIIVCNYGPGGNYQGEKPFSLGPRCSECGKEAGFCYNSLCRDCSGSNFVNGCECNLHCHNCGTLDESTCTCSCAPGWDGADCSKQCDDHHQWCNKSPGWPGPDFCDFSPEVPRFCRKMCGLCSPPDPNFKCSGSGEQAGGIVERDAGIQAGCVDSESDCVRWANDGYCEESEWMMDNCQKSCNTCLSVGQDSGQNGGQNEEGGQQQQPACEDSETDCVSWANDGHCETSQWVQENCRKSCDNCPNGEQDTTQISGQAGGQGGGQDSGQTGSQGGGQDSGQTGSQGGGQDGGQTGSHGGGQDSVQNGGEPANTNEGEDCEDSDTDCVSWASDGACQTSQWVLQNCRKSCDNCPEQDPIQDGDQTGSQGGDHQNNDQNGSQAGNTNEGEGRQQTTDCEDSETDCVSWANDGHCETSQWVQENCRKSCDNCPSGDQDPSEEGSQTGSQDGGQTSSQGGDQNTGHNGGQDGDQNGTQGGDQTTGQNGGQDGDQTGHAGEQAGGQQIPACEDSNAGCVNWANNGHCETSDWMLDNCRRSCDTCRLKPLEPTTSPPPCRDRKEGCPGWAQTGECESNADWMLQNCKLSCKVCQSENGGGNQGETRAGNRGGVTQQPGLEPTTAPLPCEDSNRGCPGWAETGECEQNPNWMLQNCKLSCNICDTDGENVDGGTGVNQGGGTEIEVTQPPGVEPTTALPPCEDSEQGCPGWAETGECEKNPTWMRQNCRVSCEVCEPEVGESGGNKGGEIQPDCEDNNIDCDYWAQDGHCETSTYVQENCPKSCRLCDTEGENGDGGTGVNQGGGTGVNQGGGTGVDQGGGTGVNQGGGTGVNQGGGTEIDVTQPPGVEPTTALPPCEDSEQGCPGWAETGECEKNPTWMRQNCRVSCEVCEPEVEDSGGNQGGDIQPGRPGCEDNNIDCGYWAEDGHCEISTYVQENCPKSCSLCQTEPDGERQGQTDGDQGVETDTDNQGSTDTGNQDNNTNTDQNKGAVTQQPGSADCEDSLSDCVAWSDAGYCTNSDYVQENCPKSCFACAEHVATHELKTDNPGERTERSGNQTDGGSRGGENTGGDQGSTDTGGNQGSVDTDSNQANSANTGGNQGGSQQPDCEDNEADCGAWAESGHCQTSQWVKDNCQRTCDTCRGNRVRGSLEGAGGNQNQEGNGGDQEGQTDTNQGSGINAGGNQVDVTEQPETWRDCVDSNVDCESWAAAQHCETSQWVRTTCRKSCNSCRIGGENENQEGTEPDTNQRGRSNTDINTGDTDTSNTGSNPVGATQQSGCEDSTPECVNWANGGHCETLEWMLENCQRSCDSCGYEPKTNVVGETDGGNNNADGQKDRKEQGSSSEAGNQGGGETNVGGSNQGSGNDTAKARSGVMLPYCNVEFTAVTAINGELYCFKEDKLWRFARVRKGRLLSFQEGEVTKKTFPKVSTQMKAAYQRRDDKVIMIRGSDMWLSTYTSAKDQWIPDQGYPKKIKTLALPSNPSAAFYDMYEDKSYFFKGSYVWRYNEYRRTIDIAKGRLKKLFKGVPKRPSSAFQDVNGDAIFLSGTDYYRVPYRTKKVSAGPLNFASTFLIDC